MTKQCIKEMLQLMKNYADGKARQEANNSTDIMDYGYGKSVAYKDIAERLDMLIDELEK